MALVLLYLRDGHPADTACWRRCHASIKSRQTSPTGDERQNKRKSGPSPADSLNESQLAARSGTSPPRRTSPTSPMRTASLVATATGARVADRVRARRSRCPGMRPVASDSERRGNVSAEPLGQSDDDALRAAQEAEPVDVLVLRDLADELRPVAAQTRNDVV